MGIWDGRTLPCTYGAFPVPILNASTARRFNLARHGAIGRDGESLDPLGSDSAELRFTAVFCGENFEGHKSFAALLDQSNLPSKAVAFVHPVHGAFEVYCTEYAVNIDAKELTALVPFSLLRHVPVVAAPQAIAPFVPVVFDSQQVAADLSSYLVRLAAIKAFQVAWLQAAITLMRAAGELPGWIDRTLASFGPGFCRWIESLFIDPFTPDQPLDDGIKSRGDRCDQVNRDFRAGMGCREAVYSSVVENTAVYNCGRYAGQAALSLTISPPARQHAALVACAILEAVAAGTMANVLTSAVLDRDRDGSLDANAADAAVVALRWRIQGASRLLAAVQPYDCGRSCSALSLLADGLTRLLANARIKRPPLRSVTLRSTCKPLALIALEELGSAARADEIAALNPEIVGDFNRLDRLTVLRVPAQ